MNRPYIFLRFVIVGIFFLTTLVVNGQPTKGSVLIGGTLDYLRRSDLRMEYQSSIGNSSKTMWQLTPRIGYFFSKNFAAGLTFGYGKVRTKFEGRDYVSRDRDDFYSIGAFGRYYFYHQDGRFAWLIQGRAEYSSQPMPETVTQVLTAKTLNIDFSPGVVFFPSRRVSFEFMLDGIGYSKVDGKSSDDYHGSYYQYGFNLDLLKPKFNVSLLLGNTSDRDPGLQVDLPGKGFMSLSGQVRVSPKAGTSYGNDFNFRATAMQLSASLFLTKSFSAGVMFGGGSYQSTNNAETKTTPKNTLGAFVRWHKMPENSRMMLISEIQYTSQQFENLDKGQKGSFSLGFSYFMTSKLALELMFETVSYAWRSPKYEVDQTIISLGNDLMSPDLSLRYYFRILKSPNNTD